MLEAHSRAFLHKMIPRAFDAPGVGTEARFEASGDEAKNILE